MAGPGAAAVTVRELGLLLLGLPERWQDVTVYPSNTDQPIVGVDLFDTRYTVNGLRRLPNHGTKPSHVRMNSDFNPTVDKYGVVHPLQSRKVFGK